MEGPLYRLLISSQFVSKHCCHRPFLFQIGRFLKIFLPKTALPVESKLVGIIYGKSSIKIAYFVSIRIQTWPPQAILVSDWLIS